MHSQIIIICLGHINKEYEYQGLIQQLNSPHPPHRRHTHPTTTRNCKEIVQKIAQPLLIKDR